MRASHRLDVVLPRDRLLQKEVGRRPGHCQGGAAVLVRLPRIHVGEFAAYTERWQWLVDATQSSCVPWPKLYIVKSLPGEMAHSVKYLPQKCKNPSLSPRTQIEKPGCGEHTINPSTGEVEMSGSLRFTGQPA